jgi:high affinity Mn2+ porin
MDWRIEKSHSVLAEYEVRYQIGKMAGAWSLLTFANTARMGSYEQVLSNPILYGNNIAATRQDGRTKYGFGLSMEQQFTHGLGAFLRLSANDGTTESWAFTEIDRSLAIGAVEDGELWHRNKDEAGAAVVVNGLSAPHRRYLAGGGYGFIIGDGALNYGPETEGDIYYKLSLTDLLAVSGIYQPILNPGYNQDRGPVHVFSIRVAAKF